MSTAPTPDFHRHWFKIEDLFIIENLPLIYFFYFWRSYPGGVVDAKRPLDLHCDSCVMWVARGLQPSVSQFATKPGHSGSNLANNSAHFKTSLLMWHRVNEERGVWSNIICYCNITQSKAKWVYNVINDIIYDTTCMLLCTMEVVTMTSVICMTLV